MKTNCTAVCVSLAVAAIAVLSLHVPEDAYGPAVVPVGMDSVATSGSIQLDSRGARPASTPGLEGMANALYTIDESGEEIKDSPGLSAGAIPLQSCTMSPVSLRHTELILKANRIMEALYRDGLLAESGSCSSAAAATPSYAGAHRVIQQFRHLQLQLVALLPRTREYGDQDSLVIHGWDNIRSDVAQIHGMAAALRNETELATRNTASSGLPRYGGFTHLYCVEEDFDAQAVTIVP